MLLLLLAVFGLMTVQMAFAKQGGQASDCKKKIYSIRKETLGSLTIYTPPAKSNREQMKSTVADYLARWAKEGTPADPGALHQVPFNASVYQDNEKTYVLIHEQEGIRAGGGLYLFRKPPDQRCEVLMAPHGFFDLYTGRIGVESFFGTRADALLLNSASRYTGNRKSKKDIYGTDVAHRDDNYYFSVFQALADNCSEGVFVQLHGFNTSTYFDKPAEQFDIILSAGDDVGKAVGWAKKASAIFSKEFPKMKIARYGVEIGGLLGGESNVHKRYIAKKKDHLFFHIEMSKELRTKLKDDRAYANMFYKCLDQLLLMKK